jgi:hypothetical protein
MVSPVDGDRTMRIAALIVIAVNAEVVENWIYWRGEGHDGATAKSVRDICPSAMTERYSIGLQQSRALTAGYGWNRVSERNSQII